MYNCFQYAFEIEKTLDNCLFSLEQHDYKHQTTDIGLLQIGFHIMQVCFQRRKGAFVQW